MKPTIIAISSVLVLLVSISSAAPFVSIKDANAGMGREVCLRHCAQEQGRCLHDAPNTLAGTGKCREEMFACYKECEDK